MKLEWISEPEWDGIEVQNDEQARRLSEVVETATGVTMNEGQEVRLVEKDMPFFQGASAAGLLGAHTIFNAIKKNKKIRVRFVRD